MPQPLYMYAGSARAFEMHPAAASLVGCGHLHAGGVHAQVLQPHAHQGAAHALHSSIAVGAGGQEGPGHRQAQPSPVAGRREGGVEGMGAAVEAGRRQQLRIAPLLHQARFPARPPDCRPRQHLLCPGMHGGHICGQVHAQRGGGGQGIGHAGDVCH